MDPPITRRDLLSHRELTNLTIFRQPQGTNFRLTEEESMTDLEEKTKGLRADGAAPRLI